MVLLFQFSSISISFLLDYFKSMGSLPGIEQCLGGIFVVVIGEGLLSTGEIRDNLVIRWQLKFLHIILWSLYITAIVWGCSSPCYQYY